MRRRGPRSAPFICDTPFAGPGPNAACATPEPVLLWGAARDALALLDPLRADPARLLAREPSA